MADAEETNEKAPAVRAGGEVAAAGVGHGVVVVQPPPPQPQLLPKVSRRGVVRLAFWGGMGAMLAGIGATLLNSLWPRGVTGFGGTILAGTVDAIPPGEKVRNVEAKAWLVRFDEQQAERNGAQPGAILALYQKCPHLGCTVPWNPGFSYLDPRNNQRYSGWFRCPCHGSTYSDAGVRVFGPAPRSMDTFEVTIDDAGNITVNTGNITEGGDDNGSRAVLPG